MRGFVNKKCTSLSLYGLFDVRRMVSVKCYQYWCCTYCQKVFKFRCTERRYKSAVGCRRVFVWLVLLLISVLLPV